MAEIRVPELAESITEGTISTWFKQVGDSVEKGENIVELETDKVNVEVISEEAGVITELKAAEGDTVEVGSVIAIVEAGGTQKASNDASQQETSTHEEQSEHKEVKSEEEAGAADSSSERIVATPSARRYARENGIDLSDVNSKDPRGLIRSHDVKNSQSAPSQSAAEQKPEAPKQTASNPEKPVIREKMSRRRQTIAKKLLEVSNNTAMLTTFNEVDMTNVMELRKRKKISFRKIIMERV